MKMTMVLLVLSVALLVSAAHTDTRNKIIDLISKIPEKHPELLTDFVDNVKEQDGDCGNVFFCKVQDVVTHHNKTELEKLVTHLKHYNTVRNVKCEKELKGIKTPGIKVQLKDLMTDVVNCLKKINMNVGKSKTVQH